MFFLLPLAGISDSPNRVEQSAGRWQRLDYKWKEGDRARQGKSVPVHCASVCPCVFFFPCKCCRGAECSSIKIMLATHEFSCLY